MRKLRPELMREWDEKDRFVCGSLAVSPQFIVACVYGFPPSHPLRHTSEVMISQIFHWASTLTCAVLLLGDWNETLSSCAAMSLSHQWGLHRLNDNQPTTRSKKDGPSSTQPIDHAFCNLHALDAGCVFGVSRDLVLSDHYPITGHFLTCKNEGALAWSWPKKMDLTKGLVVTEPWTNFDTPTLTHWNSAAQRWLAKSFDTTSVDKNCVTCKPVHKKKLVIDPVYSTLMKATRALDHVRREEFPDHVMLTKMHKRLYALGFRDTEDMSLLDIERLLSQKTQESLDRAQKHALDSWKKKVRAWSISSADLFKYLRNVSPAKSVVVSVAGRITSKPSELHCALVSYWGALERWPSEQSRHLAFFALEDHYALFLPHFQAQIHVSAHDLYNKVQQLSRTSPGPDGWTVSELQALPVEAWTQFLVAVQNAHVTMPTGTSMIFRRTPIEKGDYDIPSPADVRPIDIFSLPLRALSSCQVQSLIEWKRRILHPGQFASRFGAQVAMNRIGLHSAQIRHAIAPRFAISIDFSKLFNMIDASLVERVVQLCGLDHYSATQLFFPLKGAKGHWRLPRSELGPLFRVQRGLPQGMAASVLGAEVFIALFLWRLSCTLDLEIVAYVDDINLISTTRQVLEAAISQLFRFEKTFSLQVAAIKSFVWGSNDFVVNDVALKWGFQAKKTVESLGTEWPLTAVATCGYAKDKARLAKAEERLARLSHLQR